MCADREGEAHVHARRIEFHGLVDEFAEAREFGHGIETVAHLAALQAQHHRTDEHVFAAGELAVEAAPSASTGAIRPRTWISPTVGWVMPQMS